MLFNQIASGAAIDLGLTGEQDDEAAKIRKKKQALQTMQRANGPATPFMGAFSSLMSGSGNQY